MCPAMPTHIHVVQVSKFDIIANNHPYMYIINFLDFRDVAEIITIRSGKWRIE